MKIPALFALSVLSVVNAEKINPRHYKRQAPPGSSSLAVTSGTSSPAAPGNTQSSAGPVPTTTSTSVIAPPGTTSSSTTPAQPATTGPPPAATATGIPPLVSLTSGMPTRPGLSVATSYTAGATPPISGAPVLPTPLVYVFGDPNWPQPDHVPDTNTPQVKEWMKELEGYNIPNISPTVDGSCGGDPSAASQAAQRGWWTCGGYTRDTDIVACPDKFTWGVSFDDGPSPYTQYVLNYLEEKDILATFFVVGSRVVERPALLIEEYMAGHEISVHTWSHSKPLTTLTNEQIVAELGWTRKAIKDVLGVTPTTMRPPWGDIDDRVRAISLAMGMIPVIWTATPNGNKFDTNDWKVAGGSVNGTDSFNTFQTILQQASQLETGFIVLQHDLFEVTVDLAVGYTLDAALNHAPKFNLEAIGQCQKFPAGNLYLETNQNSTFPFRNQTGGGIDVDGDGTIDTKSGDGGSTSNSNGKSAGFVNTVPLFSGSIAAFFAVASFFL